MALKVTINIDGIAGLMQPGAYGTAAVAVIERGTAQADEAYVAVGTVTLSADQSQYDWWDPDATDSSWFRYRLSDGAGEFSAWSDTIQAYAVRAYASLDDLVERLDPPDASRYNLLSDILESTSAAFDMEAGRQFYRIPQVSGTVSRTYDGDGGTELRVPEGIISLTSVEVAGQTGGAYATLGSAEWRLRPAYPEPYWPYSRVVLTDLATTSFTPGFDTVRLTGVFGWAAVPPAISEAVLQRAQATYNASQTGEGGITGLPEYGTTTVSPTEKNTWLRAVRRYGTRRGVAV